MLTKTTPLKTDPSALDSAMMRHCIRLSAKAGAQGEFPFAALICEGDRVVVEATNQVAQNADVTRHAELVAVAEAQKILRRKDLSACTLYSNVEPCAMCAFPIRETRIGRVIYAITSPLMGGLSKWNVLRDTEIADVMPEAFGPAPEVIAGLCGHEAEKVWRDWNPIIWAIIRHRGCFGGAMPSHDHLPAIPARRSWFRKLLMLRKNNGSASVAAAARSLGY
jgi:tRNA(adenine34) deaminase